MTEYRKILRWEDPPPPKNPAGGHRGRPRKSMWDQVAEILRDEPGKWAVIYEGDSVGAGSLRARIIYAPTTAWLPYGKYEVKVRSLERGYTVYARYIGDPEW